MEWLKEHWLLVLPMVLGAVSVWWLMPKGEQRSRLLGGLLGLAALGLVGGGVMQPSGKLVDDALFYLFAGAAVVAATLMITNRNPAYSALWFALVTLSVCGLFLLQSAPFLASATVIVYAGAIIVTFLFVLMLAQQAGNTTYDQYSRQPAVVACTGFVLLGALLFVVAPGKEKADDTKSAGFAVLKPPVPLTDFGNFPPPVRRAEPSPVLPPGATPPESDGTSPPQEEEPVPPPTPQSTSSATAATFGTIRGLGRTLFGDYLFAVELAGTLLLVASIGAILIAPKRSSGKL